MRLVGPVVIRFGGGLIFDELSLAADRERWEGMALMSGIGGKTFADEGVLRALLFESTPLIVTAA